MTLQEFTRDVVPIIQAVFAFLGLGMLGIVWWQVRQTSKWNKLQAEQAFATHNTYQYEGNVIKLARVSGIDLKARTTPLTTDEVKGIWDKDDLYLAVLTILNDTECTCAAINAGLVDWELAFSVHSARLAQAFKLYQPFIENIRGHHTDQSLYVEFEKVVARIEEQIMKTKQKSLQSSGVTVRT